MKVKYLKKRYENLVRFCPSFHKSGSISGMKKLYYGENALLVRCGDYIYKVDEKIYYGYAK